MALTNPDKVVTEQRLAEYHDRILPYLGAAKNTGYTPVGTIISVMGIHAPANYLICDGQTVAILDYPELANYFEQEFGTKNYFGGDGTLTFAVPDLRGEFLRGTGTNSHSGQGNGANVGVHQNATEMPELMIAGASDTNQGNIRTSCNMSKNVEWQNADSKLGESQPTTFKWFKSTDTSEYSGSKIQTIVTSRPTNTSVLYCIATKNIYVDARSNYSTSEQVVGTWIDGKPLYQKTIVGTSPSSTSSSVNAAELDINIEFAQIISSVAILSDSYEPTYNENYLNVWIRRKTNPNTGGKNMLAIRVGSDSSFINKPVYVTIQYTKTTD